MNDAQVTVNPYLNFNGNSEEVMKFYQSILGGDLQIMRFGDAQIKVPEESKNKVMHATLAFGTAIIMAADAMPNHKIIIGNNNAISVNTPSLEDATRIYMGLSMDGTILVPLDKQFWGDTFGMFEDKYGVQWMVHFGMEEK